MIPRVGSAASLLSLENAGKSGLQSKPDAHSCISRNTAVSSDFSSGSDGICRDASVSRRTDSRPYEFNHDSRINTSSVRIAAFLLTRENTSS